MKRWIAGAISLTVGSAFAYPFARLNYGAGLVVGAILFIFLYAYLVHGEKPDV